MSIIPSSRPEISLADVRAFLAAAGIAEPRAPYLVGRRGYYRDTMGVQGENDRGIYDDAIALVLPDGHVATWNANTDPSERGGRLAVLAPGVWRFKRGTHHPGTPKAYPCLVQAAPVTVHRDNGVTETGEFYIHHHWGGDLSTTGSEGCQTIPKAQWPDYFARVCEAMNTACQTEIVYVLTERARG